MNRSSSPFLLCSWQHNHDDDDDGGDGDDGEDDEQGRDGVCHDVGGDTSSYMHYTVLQDCGGDSNYYGDNNDDDNACGDEVHIFLVCLSRLQVMIIIAMMMIMVMTTT